MFTNIPAFGKDEVFGEIFQIYLDPWIEQLESQEPFSFIHVDDKGWPMNGHLIWATSFWWQKIFEAVGFKRETDIEQALHRVYDDYMRDHSPGRQTFYVFSKNMKEDSTVRKIIETIKLRGSSLC